MGEVWRARVPLGSKRHTKENRGGENTSPFFCFRAGRPCRWRCHDVSAFRRGSRVVLVIFNLKLSLPCSVSYGSDIHVTCRGRWDLFKLIEFWLVEFVEIDGVLVNFGWLIRLVARSTCHFWRVID